MWFFTTEGFYSAVEETKLKTHLGEISVRAREPGALELLRDTYMPSLSETSITPKGVTADYRYRAWIARDEFAAGLARIGMAVDYPNFKSEAAAKRGFGRFEKSLHEVWNVMAKLQPGGPYGWGGKAYPAIPVAEGGKKPKKGTKKQAALPLAGLGPPANCDDCGEELDGETGEWVGTRWLCRDFLACTGRLRSTG